MAVEIFRESVCTHLSRVFFVAQPDGLHPARLSAMRSVDELHAHGRPLSRHGSPHSTKLVVDGGGMLLFPGALVHGSRAAPQFFRAVRAGKPIAARRTDRIEAGRRFPGHARIRPGYNFLRPLRSEE